MNKYCEAYESCSNIGTSICKICSGASSSRNVYKNIENDRREIQVDSLVKDAIISVKEGLQFDRSWGSTSEYAKSLD